MTRRPAVLYIGSKLAAHGRTPTSIDTLGPLLARYYHVIYASDKKNKLLRLLDMAWKTLRYGPRVDIILIATYSTANFYYAWLIGQLARLLKIPYVPILHGGELPRRLKRSPRLSRMLFVHAAVNAAPSPYNAHFFQKADFPVTIIPNMIDIRQYPYKKRETLRPKLLWVRSLDAVYNPWMAVDVLAGLKARYPEAALTMVGPDKGVMHDVQQYAQRKGVADRITFPGRLSKKAWTTLAQDHDIFINTTDKDNTPVSVIEAMALGLPVVTTNVGGIPFLWKDGVHALLVPPREPAAMTRAVEALLENPQQAQQMAQQARRMVEAFDQPRVLNQWKELIDDIIARKKQNA